MIEHLPFILSVLMNALALISGMMTIYRHQELFMHSSPRKLFCCAVERSYWIVAFSVFNTLCMLICLLGWGLQDMSLEQPLFDFTFYVAHALGGAVLASFHLQTMGYLDSQRIANVGKNF